MDTASSDIASSSDLAFEYEFEEFVNSDSCIIPSTTSLLKNNSQTYFAHELFSEDSNDFAVSSAVLEELPSSTKSSPCKLKFTDLDGKFFDSFDVAFEWCSSQSLHYSYHSKVKCHLVPNKFDSYV